MWALYDAPLASGCQFQWHWAWRVGRLRCLHKMSFSSPRSRTYSRLESSPKLAKRKLGLGLPATFRKNHSWARPTKQQIWILQLYVSKRLGTFVTWAVRVKEQQKLWILCWFICSATRRWIFQEQADLPVPDKGSEKNWVMRLFGCSRTRPPPLCCEFSYFRRTNCNNGSMHVCSLSPFGRVLLSSRKVGPHFTGRTNPFTLNLWTVGGK